MDAQQLMTDISWAFRKQFGRAGDGLGTPSVSRLMIGIVVVGALSLVLIVGAGLWLINDAKEGASKGKSVRITSQPTSDKQANGAAAATKTGDAASSQEEAYRVTVHVAGSVQVPGVYTLLAQSRVADAIEEAGGFTRGASQASVNLAALVEDSSQIYIPSKKEVAEGQGAGPSVPSSSGGASGKVGPAGASTAGQININTATQAELESLPGIGPATAQKILEDRELNGPYATIQDLTRVSGIGDKKVQSLDGSAVAH